MMNSPAILQGLIALSVIGSAALLAILLLRPLLRRTAGPVLAYAAWLLLPLSLLAALLPHPAVHTAVFNLPMPAATQTAAGALPASAEWQAADVWLLIWAAGAVLALAFMVRRQWRFERGLGALLPTADKQVFRGTQDTQTGPLALGLLRPRIVLPADFESRYNADERRLICAHEQMHLQRGDLLANALAALLQAVFWFNPLLHFAAGRFRFDQELACDELVLRRHPQSRQDYARAILKTQLSAQGLPLACQWMSRHPVRERIAQLARPRPGRPRRLAAAGTLSGLCLAASYGAWATEATPSAPSAAADGKPRFRIAVSATREVVGSSKTSAKVDLELAQGQRIVLFPGQSGALGCEFNFELIEARADRAMVALPLNCSDGTNSNPRLLIGYGEQGKVQTGKSAPGGTLLTLTVTVTPL